MIYYPQHLKYIDADEHEHEAVEHETDGHEADAPLLPQPCPKPRLRSVEWLISLISAWIVGVHLYVSLTFYFPVKFISLAIISS